MTVLSTQPALKLALLFTAGILTAPLSTCPFWVLLASLIMMTGLAMVFTSRKHTGTSQLYVALAIVLMGAARFIMTGESVRPDHVNQHIGKPDILIEGRLIKDPAVKSGRIEYRVDVRYISIHDAAFSAHGRVSISVHDTAAPTLRYGDGIVAKGALEKAQGRRNPGGFDYRAYLKTRGIDALFRLKKHHPLQPTGMSGGSPILKAVYPARRWMASAISAHYSGRSEALLKALILGDRSLLTSEMRELFARVGIIHVLAVSGLHVGFILLILTGLLKPFRLPGPLKTGAIILGLLFFMLLTEANAPVVRAVIMTCLYLIGKQLDRDTDIYNIIGLAAFILLMIEPRFLYDAGFQLSFTAVLSIVYLYGRFQSFHWVKSVNRAIRRLKPAYSLWSLLLVSVSAQLGTMMITACHFNRLSVSGMVANLFAIPLVGAIIPIEFVRLLLLPLSPDLAALNGMVNEFLISLLLRLSETLSTGSWVSFYVPTPHWMTMAAFTVAVILLFNLTRRRMIKPLIFMLLILLNTMAWREVALHRSDRMTYVQLDVGQGDAAIIHLPRGKTVLVDGGPWSPAFDAGERLVAPYLHHRGIRTLDAIILTHAHSDHVGGLPHILKTFPVRQVLISDSTSESELFRAFLNTAYTRKIPIQQINAPDSLTLSCAKFYFLSPDSLMRLDRNHNNRSIVTLLCYGRHRLLLTGDAEIPVEQQLIQTLHPLRAHVLKVGHHGSKTSSSEIFLQWADPDAAIISVGERNRFKHPSPRIVARLDSLAIPTYRTDRDGAVIFMSDGRDFLRID